ncbi:hypothetical protein WJX73_007623 [Symbiochloris irregularis]|uniref:Uncharacterized protein n=1 Tax=Symbiochloris irregularis TaxID=706552 RepID=A0AAW1NTK6_9CHLO
MDRLRLRRLQAAEVASAFTPPSPCIVCAPPPAPGRRLLWETSAGAQARSLLASVPCCSPLAQIALAPGAGHTEAALSGIGASTGKWILVAAAVFAVLAIAVGALCYAYGLRKVWEYSGGAIIRTASTAVMMAGHGISRSMSSMGRTMTGIRGQMSRTFTGMRSQMSRTATGMRQWGNKRSSGSGDGGASSMSYRPRRTRTAFFFAEKQGSGASVSPQVGGIRAVKDQDFRRDTRRDHDPFYGIMATYMNTVHTEHQQAAPQGAGPPIHPLLRPPLPPPPPEPAMTHPVPWATVVQPWEATAPPLPNDPNFRPLTQGARTKSTVRFQ